MKDLVIFTHSFPYQNSETYLATEVNLLAKRFDRIFIVPSKGGNQQIALADNVEVITSLIRTKPRFLIEVFFRNFFSVLSIFGWTLSRKYNLKVYLRFYKSFLHFLLEDLNKYHAILSFIKDRKLHGAIFYDYWFVNSTISLSLLRKKGIIRKCVCRAHGFDLYDERNYETRVSYRDYKVHHLDNIFVISLHGRNYLKSKVSRKYHHKISCSYLGVERAFPEYNIKKTYISSNRFLVVSCSRMVPLKRVELIPKILKSLQIPVHWVHFGDGPTYQEVQLNAAKLNEASYSLYGKVDNDAIHQFYLKYNVGLFVSLSVSEGLPVTMMEAIAYGIPIFSTDVGGVKEIVNSDVGSTIPLESSNNFIAEEMQRMFRGIACYDREKIMQVYTTRFSANTNYQSFVNDLLVGNGTY